MKNFLSIVITSTISLASLTSCQAPAGVSAANDLLKQLECAVGKTNLSDEQKTQFQTFLNTIKSAIQASQAGGATADAALKSALDSIPQNVKDSLKNLGC